MGALQITMRLLKNFGIGADIESIERFSRPEVINNKLFLNKIFTKKELKYCFSKKNPAPHLAARYAGKEAVFKALSSIGISKPNYRLLEIFNNKNNIPEVKITDAKFKNVHIYISMSHCDDKAMAFAVVMGLDKHGQA